MSNSLRSRILLTIATAAVAAPLGVILAHDDHATGIYKVRHDEYHKLGDAFKVIRDQTRANAPDAAAIKNAAVVVNNAANEQFNWFPADSGPKEGVKTRAKAEIWSKPQDFNAAQKLFQEQAGKLNTVAAAGDVAAVRAQFGEVGKACKNCHDNFRTPED
ncbi:MAG TPA: cytochrome c [Povalibacter sp.]|uniref:c-type cytochrome n=1 Tax=Povalibacter sp. TaxID=1962978 RepID=UPI002BC43619|nr:cytochrome c [Povalibacter sp.]HMN45474.1 cytochrome c [Povalibacter sp.]